MDNTKVFILRVCDSEDAYLYLCLVLDSEKEFIRAKDLIEKFDDDYYAIIDGDYSSEEGFEDCYTGNYYEDLLSFLDKCNIQSLPYTMEDIYVR